MKEYAVRERVPDWSNSECSEYDLCHSHSGGFSHDLEGTNCGRDRYCTFSQVAKKGRLIAGLLHNYEKYPTYNWRDDLGKKLSMKVIADGKVSDTVHGVQIVDSCLPYDCGAPPDDGNNFDIDLEFWTALQKQKEAAEDGAISYPEYYMPPNVYDHNSKLSPLFAEFMSPNSMFPDPSDGIFKRDGSDANKLCIKRPSRYDR